MTSLVISGGDFRSGGGWGSGTVGAAQEDFSLLFIAESASAPLKHPQEAAGLGGGDLGV